MDIQFIDRKPPNLIDNGRHCHRGEVERLREWREMAERAIIALQDFEAVRQKSMGRLCQLAAATPARCKGRDVGSDKGEQSSENLEPSSQALVIFKPSKKMVQTVSTIFVRQTYKFNNPGSPPCAAMLSVMTFSAAKRIRLLGPPALGPVPDRPSPPKG